MRHDIVGLVPYILQGTARNLVVGHVEPRRQQGARPVPSAQCQHRVGKMEQDGRRQRVALVSQCCQHIGSLRRDEQAEPGQNQHRERRPDGAKQRDPGLGSRWLQCPISSNWVIARTSSTSGFSGEPACTVASPVRRPELVTVGASTCPADRANPQNVYRREEQWEVIHGKAETAPVRSVLALPGSAAPAPNTSRGQAVVLGSSSSPAAAPTGAACWAEFTGAPPTVTPRLFSVAGSFGLSLTVRPLNF